MRKTDKEIFHLMENISYEDIFRYCDDENLQTDDSLHFKDNDNTGTKDYSMQPSAPPSGGGKLPRMKLKVMGRIKSSALKNLWIKSLLAAGLILFVFLTAATPLGQRTLAKIIDKLYFIPGSGKAVVNETEDVYVLPRPITIEHYGSTFTIHTITKKYDSITIYATGSIYLYSSNLSIVSDGIEYKSSSSSIGYGGNNAAVYCFTIPGDDNNFTIKINDEYSIPVELKKAEGFEDYEELGPTDIINDFGLTLVPVSPDNKIQFDILQHHTNRGQISLYGSCDKEGHNHINIRIHDNHGRSFSANYPASHIGTQSSFSFTPEDMADSYTIGIPEVTIKYDLDNKLSLPMPPEGETIVNKTVDLQGFPVDITKIVRKDDLLTVYVNSNYNDNHPENICYFLPDMDKMSLDYYHWILNDRLTTEAFEFYINPDKKTLTIYFKELYTVLKGPWTFEITGKIQ